MTTLKKYAVLLGPRPFEAVMHEVEQGKTEAEEYYKKADVDALIKRFTQTSCGHSITKENCLSCAKGELERAKKLIVDGDDIIAQLKKQVAMANELVKQLSQAISDDAVRSQGVIESLQAQLGEKDCDLLAARTTRDRLQRNLDDAIVDRDKWQNSYNRLRASVNGTTANDLERLAALEKDKLRIEARIELLETAIRTHRNQKADDRCIEDDDVLYEALGDGIKCDRRVGDKAEMLKNCARFITKRCLPGGWPTYVELEEEIVKLKAQLK